MFRLAGWAALHGVSGDRRRWHCGLDAVSGAGVDEPDRRNVLPGLMVQADSVEETVSMELVG